MEYNYNVIIMYNLGDDGISNTLIGCYFWQMENVHLLGGVYMRIPLFSEFEVNSGRIF